VKDLVERLMGRDPSKRFEFIQSRARASVPPMYMPGRRRTGSSPSSTSIEEAS
jgi:hypothetical protein